MIIKADKFETTRFHRDINGICEAIDDVEIYFPKQVGGGTPSPAYVASAMSDDCDRPDRIVVIHPGHIEVWA